MQSDKDIPGISCGLVDSNVLQWEVMLMISDECRFYGGMHFPTFSKTPAKTSEKEKDKS